MLLHHGSHSSHLNTCNSCELVLVEDITMRKVVYFWLSYLPQVYTARMTVMPAWALCAPNTNWPFAKVDLLEEVAFHARCSLDP